MAILSLLTSAGLALSVSSLALYVIFKLAGEWIIDTLLILFRPGVESSSQALSGPRWQWSNGQVPDKFLNGKAKAEEWRKYGPIYRVWAGLNPEIVITTPEALRAFHTDSVNHGKPINGNFGYFLGQLLGRCAGLVEGDEWRNMRRIVDPPFRHAAAVARVQETESEAKSFVESLPSMATPGTSENKDSLVVHAASAFMKFPFFFTAEVVYGKMSEREKEDLWVVAQKRLALLPYFFSGLYRSRWGKYWDPVAYQKLDAFVIEWREYNAGLAQTRRKEGRLDVPVVTYWDEIEKGDVRMDDILHTLDEMLFANLDVTTHVLTWVITLIADHPAAQSQLRDEIAAHSSDIHGYIASTNTHLHRCFFESLRVRPLAIFSIAENTAPGAPKVLPGGVVVKPSTTVLVDTLGINIRNPFWGVNSDVFDPSRFLKVKGTDIRYNLFVFGFGHRKCLGQHIAQHMIKAIVVHLFSRYQVGVVKGKSGKDEYSVDKNSWVPMADVSIELRKLPEMA